MNLPKIDISALPDLDTITGIFGSLANAAHVQSSDDTLIIMMVFVYESIPHGVGG
ncbi:MAG: hypothetical protein ACKOOL_09110 [Novosphingobium sp.]